MLLLTMWLLFADNNNGSLFNKTAISFYFIAHNGTKLFIQFASVVILLCKWPRWINFNTLINPFHWFLIFNCNHSGKRVFDRGVANPGPIERLQIQDYTNICGFNSIKRIFDDQSQSGASAYLQSHLLIAFLSMSNWVVVILHILCVENANTVNYSSDQPVKSLEKLSAIFHYNSFIKFHYSIA